MLKGDNMQRSHSAGGVRPVRPTGKAWLALAKYRRILLFVSLSVVVVASGVTGYFLGNGSPTAAISYDDSSSVVAFGDELAQQNDLCAAVEQVNIEDQLAAQKQLNDDLANSLDTQQQEIDTLEETILNALMANLSDKMISRSSSGIDAVCTEAKNLITLNRKLKAFKKTDEAEQVDLTEYQDAINKRLLSLPTLKPVAGSLDGYGWRTHPIYGYKHFHPAVDIGAPTGTKIKAAGAGRVVDAGYNSSSGKYVKINHGNGFVTMYLHCSKLNVSAGDRVDKGEVIALVGSTGTSTTPHLHFQVEYYGSPVNPRKIIME
jgi:murein DD-endopeptidase MepM/ murein hydrolase activator NlpD